MNNIEKVITELFEKLNNSNTSKEDVEKILDDAFNAFYKSGYKDMDEFMTKPLLSLVYTRNGVNIKGGGVMGLEIDDMIEAMCTTLLDLIPSEKRMDIVFKSMNNCKTVNGQLFDNMKETGDGRIISTNIDD